MDAVDSYFACFGSPCYCLSRWPTRCWNPQKTPARPPDRPTSSHHTDWWSIRHSPGMSPKLAWPPVPFWVDASASRWSPASIWPSGIGCTWDDHRNCSFSIGSRPSHHLGSWTDHSEPIAAVAVLRVPLKRCNSLAFALNLGESRTAAAARFAKPSSYIWGHLLPLRWFDHQNLYYCASSTGYPSFLCLRNFPGAVAGASAPSYHWDVSKLDLASDEWRVAGTCSLGTKPAMAGAWRLTGRSWRMGETSTDGSFPPHFHCSCWWWYYWLL